MKTKNFGNSLKNIPIPSKSKYLKCMVEKVESFVRRLRCKAYHFCKENRENDSDNFKNFGLKSLVAPQQNEDWNAFENYMYDIINRNEFLDYLNKDNKYTIIKKCVKSTNYLNYLVVIISSCSMAT